MKCKNCSEKLTGQEEFCSNCGQKNISKLNLKYLIKEVADNLFEVDSKLFVTLKYLIIKPGFLSKEYIEGKRTSYVAPVRLYVILSVLFFFTISLIDVDETNNQDSSASTEGSGITFSSNKSSVSIPTSELKRMDYEGTLDHYLDSITVDENAAMEYFIRKSVKSKINGDGFGDIVMNQVSLFLLIFMPFLALLYATCLSGNKIGFIGHLVFNLHLNSFVILSLLIALLVDWFITNETIEIIWGVLVVLFGQFYLIKAIMKFYERKWWIAFCKYFLLLFGYLILGVVFMVFVIISSMVML